VQAEHRQARTSAEKTIFMVGARHER
jgi:hypothetical protein